MKTPISLYEKAIELASYYHKNQKDESGVPCIEHVRKVSDYCSDENAKIVAMLHDILEDTECTRQDLENAGIPMELIDRISLLTKREGMSEEEYYSGIKADPCAREVKISDLLHNMDLSRLDNPSKYQINRNIRYLKKLCYLLGRTESIA